MQCKHGHKSGRYKSGHCKACQKAAAVRWQSKRVLTEAQRVEHRAYMRRAQWKSRGFPEPTRPEPKACECCGSKPGRLRLDHDHGTGKFRGWLCDKCNRGIGFFGDTLAGVRAAVAYLRRALNSKRQSRS